MINNNLQGKEVVIIDDSKAWSTAMMLHLQKNGCSVTYFENQNKYIDFLKDKGPNACPDAVIVDYHLIGETAPRVIKDIREVCKDTLILSVSGEFRDGDDNLKTDKMIECLNAGANRALCKDSEGIMYVMSTHFEVRKQLCSLPS